ncbi:MAG: hypothetical protein JW913_09050 [Chitinispirillaceae bacterium]|nr:hypothetical protein [Chitinispirillaceae bacterium]
MMVKTTRRQILLNLIFLCCINAYSTDTLTTERDYLSPISNPTTIEYYNDCFWIANLSNPKVYKLNNDMTLDDSIEIHRSRICGICHKNGRLWVSIDEPVPDVATVSNDVPYRIYKIDVSSKTISDSLLFILGGIPSHTGLLFGLGISNDTFIISVSSGIYSINTEGGIQRISNSPFSGLTVIGNGLWGIRRNNITGIGNMILSLTKDDSLAIPIDVNGSDIAYDGNNIFVCDPDQSKIHKLTALKVPVKNKIKHIADGEPRSAFKVISFSYEPTSGNRASLFTLNGQTARFLRKKNQTPVYQVIVGIGK